MARIFVKKLALFASVCFASVDGQNLKRDEIIFHYNNTYKYNVPYTVEVDKNIEYIMEFGGDGAESYDTPARVTVASDFANRTYPLFVTARQQKGVFSWQLPMLVQTPVSLEQFSNISRTLCPHNNLFSEDEDTCDISPLNTPIIHLTSSSPEPIRVTILVETVQDFYIKLDTVTNLTITPSQPKYYFYPFDQNANLKTQSIKRKYRCNQKLDEDELNHFFFIRNSLLGTNIERNNYGWFSKPKSVIVMIESDDDICAVVSIQNFSCPVFDNERDILYDGYYLTMTRRGGITLTQDTFPLGFYVVFIVKSSDEDCAETKSTNGTLPKMAHYFGWTEQTVEVPSSDGRVKTFRIIETISYQEYIIAAAAALSFFLSFYLAFIIAIVCQRRQGRSDCQLSEEGGLISPVVPHDASTLLDPPSPCRPSINAMGDSQESCSRLVGGEDEGMRTEGGLISPDLPPSAANVSDVPSTIPRRRHVRATGASVSVMGDSHDSFLGLVGDGYVIKRTDPDGSSSSDTESGQEDNNTDKNIYRHGSRLCVANLARCRPRVLQARSKMYLWNVLTVAIFYTLPVIQLVVTYQRLLNQSGNQDLCYFNFLCAHPLLVVSDFNHVYSNVGYVLLGALFLMQVYRRHRNLRRRQNAGVGIPQHFGLLYAMGVALVSEGLLSAAYHVCPNSMNFQFDTSFMYVTSVLCMVKIYQSRHPDINARAHATFGVLALIIFIGLVGVLNANFYFWIAFTIIHITSCLIMTFQIYYLGRFRLEWGVIYRASRELITRPLAAITPTHCGRCVLLIIANLANWAIAAYGLVQHSKDFASHLLLVLMSNLFLYTLFYIVMKLLHRESIRWYSWVFIALTYTVWFSSSYFYLDQSTNWALTPAQSRQSNRQCSLLQLYDSHDVWHFMSATAMFFSFNMYLTIDDNLNSVPQRDITVF